MNGFPLKTHARTFKCDKCKLYYPKKKHTCQSREDFVRLVPGENEYASVIQMLSDFDAGTWNSSVLIQVARITSTGYWYILATNFFSNHIAMLINDHFYAKLKPFYARKLDCDGVPSILYINEDYSAAIIPLSLFEEEE
jgi:hypothetical protein